MFRDYPSSVLDIREYDGNGWADAFLNENVDENKESQHWTLGSKWITNNEDQDEAKRLNAFDENTSEGTKVGCYHTNNGGDNEEWKSGMLFKHECLQSNQWNYRQYFMNISDYGTMVNWGLNVYTIMANINKINKNCNVYYSKFTESLFVMNNY